MDQQQHLSDTLIHELTAQVAELKNIFKNPQPETLRIIQKMLTPIHIAMRQISKALHLPRHRPRQSAQTTPDPKEETPPPEPIQSSPPSPVQRKKKKKKKEKETTCQPEENNPTPIEPAHDNEIPAPSVSPTNGRHQIIISGLPARFEAQMIPDFFREFGFNLSNPACQKLGIYTTTNFVADWENPDPHLLQIHRKFEIADPHLQLRVQPANFCGRCIGLQCVCQDTGSIDSEISSHEASDSEISSHEASPSGSPPPSPQAPRLSVRTEIIITGSIENHTTADWAKEIATKTGCFAIITHKDEQYIHATLIQREAALPTVISGLRNTSTIKLKFFKQHFKITLNT